MAKYTILYSSTFFRNISIAVALLFVFSCSPTRRLKQGEYLLTKNIIVEKKTKIEKADIANYIKQKPNKKILTRPFYLQVHNLVNEENVKKWREEKNKKIDKINEKRARKGKKMRSKDRLSPREWLLDIGEEPVVYDSALAKLSVKQISMFLNNKGYFNNRVKDSVFFKAKNAVVHYKIEPGQPYTIRNVSYEIDDDVMAYYVFSDTSNCLIKRGNNYDADVLQNERDRITKEASNNGYYHFSKEYIYYKVDSNLNGHQLDIVLGIKKFAVHPAEYPDSLIEKNHQRYYINNVYIVTDYTPGVQESKKKDTLSITDYTILYAGDLKYKPAVLLNAVFLRKGDLFQHRNAEDTYGRLSELKAFKLINIQFTEIPAEKDKLDCYIQLVPILKQAFTIETEGTNTSGNLGVSGSIVYQNRNVFKGLEVLELKLKGGLQAQKLVNEAADKKSKGSPFNTFEFGPEATLEVPRFLLPFRIREAKSANPKTRFSSALNYQVRPDYKRYASNISFGYSWKQSAKMRHTINPLEISFIKIDKQPGFDDFIKKTNDLLILNSYTDHFVTATRYSFFYNEQDLKKNKNFSLFKFNVESSGNILRGIYNVSGQPKDADGSYRMFNIKYAQYLRSDADYRYYKIFSGNSSLVFRIFVGVGKPLHNLRVLPFEKSFFGGGTNGIRAWRARSLGPGGFTSLAATSFDQIGDGQFESNLEYRFKIYKMLKSAVFIDMGNVWLRKKDINRAKGEFNIETFYKQIAIGSGIGTRYDFSFFILRLDLGVKLRDPAIDEKDRWVVTHLFDPAWKNDKRDLYGKKYSFLTLNFAIGYPF